MSLRKADLRSANRKKYLSIVIARKSLIFVAIQKNISKLKTD